jgi:type IV fimbrial biogenesis protein FimT
MLNNPGQRGLSLIELMIGLAVFALLLLVAMPSYSAWIQNTKIRNTADSLVSGLQLARSEALRRNTNVQFVIGPDSDWTVSVVNPLTTVQTRPTGQGSVGVTVARTPAAATTLTFNSLGRIGANADGSASITQIDLDVPVALLPASASRELRLAVGAGGRVRMCDPNVADATDTRYC